MYYLYSVTGPLHSLLLLVLAMIMVVPSDTTSTFSDFYCVNRINYKHTYKTFLLQK